MNAWVWHLEEQDISFIDAVRDCLKRGFGI